MITVGVGDMIDQGFLKAMASTPADFHFCNDSVEPEGAFLNVATLLAAQSKPTPLT